MIETCATCRYAGSFMDQHSITAECRRLPPTGTDDAPHPSAFPRVAPAMWCGEHRVRAELDVRAIDLASATIARTLATLGRLASQGAEPSGGGAPPTPTGGRQFYSDT